MNRQAWFRVLQVAVVAPWLFHISGKTNEKYFSIGLKLVAGSIIMLNIKPLMQDYADAQKAISDLAKSMQTPATKIATVIDGDIEEAQFSEQ